MRRRGWLEAVPFRSAKNVWRMMRTHSSMDRSSRTCSSVTWIIKRQCTRQSAGQARDGGGCAASGGYRQIPGLLGHWIRLLGIEAEFRDRSLRALGVELAFAGQGCQRRLGNGFARDLEEPAQVFPVFAAAKT